MKLVQTTIIAGLAFFLSAGISFAAELDDLDLTIRVIESDDVEEIHNELSLPDMASDTAREHAESEDGKGLTQANEAREREEEHEELEDERAEHEEEVEEKREEHDDAQEDEDHEKEHEENDASRTVL